MKKLVFNPIGRPKVRLKFNPTTKPTEEQSTRAVSPLMEKRFHATEVRAVKNGNKKTIAGYAARYNVLSHPLPAGNGQKFRERIAPGAFKRILATNPDVVATFNHDVNKVLGRTSAGTLRLSENARGLQFECDLPDTEAGRDTYESVSRGDLNACSFAFTLGDRMDHFAEEDCEEEDEGMRGKLKRAVKRIVRTIRDFADLIDVSVVTHPAYPGTAVDARHLLVAGEVRSRIEAMKPVAAVKEDFNEVDVRKRRLAVLDL